MTYPPQSGQPPHDQQPNQGWQYPPTGSFPQPGGQYGYAQQGQYPAYYAEGYPGGQYPPGNYPPGYDPQPPQKKTGLWIGLSAATVVVVVFVITAFLTPGFLLSDDDTDNDDTQNPANANAEIGRESNGAGSAQQFARQLISTVNAHDTATLTELSCPDADSNVAANIDTVDQVNEARIVGPVQESGGEAHLGIAFTAQDTQQNALIELKKSGNTWCWNNIVGSRNSGALEGPGESELPGTPDDSGQEGPSSHSPDAAALSRAATASVEKFLDALNNGDKAKATKLFCSETNTIGVDSLDEVTEGSANLAMDPETEKVYKYIDSYSVDLTGTLNGKEIAFGALSVHKPDPGDNFCVKSFFFAA